MGAADSAPGECDYLLVGAGNAGCLLANRLSRGGKHSVVLLEAGGSGRWNPWIRVPIGYLRTMNSPGVDWCFDTEPNPHLAGRSLDYPRGKVLGGSSAINGMIYMRGQAADYDRWEALGNKGWGWKDMLAHFKRHEDNARLGGEFHGQGGEWRVEDPRVSWRILDLFMDAAKEQGIPRVDDFNSGDNLGSSYFQINQRRGMRVTAADAFLRPAMGRENLSVVTGAMARRLVLRDGRAEGVEVSVRGETRVFRARKEVVLSAGAIGSPQLLQLSGIGPRGLLEKHGIDCVRDLQGVGENLQDHLQVRAAFEVTGIDTLNLLVKRPLWKVGAGIEYLLSRSGALSMAPSQAGCFTRSSDAAETADLQYHVQPLSLAMFGRPLDDFSAFTASVAQLRPHSRGHVRIRGAEPELAPEIDPRHLSDKRDREVAAEAIRVTRRIVAGKALAPHRPTEVRPGSEITGTEELAAAAGRISTTIFHPVGTCKMGSDGTAVVDDRLRVREIEALRVIDASIMPDIVSGNTSSPTLAIAEKGAEMVLEDAG